MKTAKFRLNFSTNILKNLTSNSKKRTNWFLLMQSKTIFWLRKFHLITRSLPIGSLKSYMIPKTVSSNLIVSLSIQESTQISSIFHKIMLSLKFSNLMFMENGLQLSMKAKNTSMSTKLISMINLTF